jgi:iron(III) transport system ATP-binding protein
VIRKQRPVIEPGSRLSQSVTKTTGYNNLADVIISNVKKSYGSVVALHDISLIVPSGSFFTLLGPSGCGKTTLLRTIAGFHRQDAGTISVAGQVLDSMPVHKRDVGMVFQDYAIFPHISVRKNVAFGLQFQKLTRAEQNSRVMDMLEIVQLTHLADRMPHELSGGQQQRVGLARALVTRPQVLLMDEPLSNLDAQLRIDLRRELRSIQQNLGITTLYVTHDQEEALEMSDYVCVMHKGIIQHSDTPWTIYQEPANRFVASFVGSNNFLPVTFTADKPGNRACICGIDYGARGETLEYARSQSIVASVRPEHVKLHIPGNEPVSAEECFNIPALLKHQSFAGRELRLTAEAPDGTLLHFISEPLAEYLRLVPGNTVNLQVPRNKISFFHADEVGPRL